MFRFEGLDIWKGAIQITDKMFIIAENLECRYYYKFADQLRASALSISNNIAEGSGSSSRKDFIKFLNYAHRSIFETVYMLIIARRRNYINDQQSQLLKKNLKK